MKAGRQPQCRLQVKAMMTLTKILVTGMEKRAQVQCINQQSLESWVYLYIYRYNIGRTDGEAEASGHLMRTSDSLVKTLILG